MTIPRHSLAGLLTTTGVLLASASPSFAASVTPTVVDGNPTCAELAALVGQTGWQELKVDPPKAGEYTSADGALKLTVTTDGKSFDFAVADGEVIEAAYAKAGTEGGNLYNYAPDGRNADTGLVAPTTGGNDVAAELSHISFCYVPDKKPPVPTPPPTTTEEQPPAAAAAPESPAAPAEPAAPDAAPAPQGAVLGKVVSKKAKKKARKKARKARRKVKAVRVQAVRTPRFTG
jgi:hypothetical protein